MKKWRSLLYILMFLVILILRVYLHEILPRRKEYETELVYTYFTLTHIKPNCWYSTDRYFFQIPRCEEESVGDTLQLVGSHEGGSDNSLFEKKRLIIESKEKNITSIASFNYWNGKYLQLREKLFTIVATPARSLLPYPHDELLLSMLFGASSGIDDTTAALFLKTGTSHVQAVSGYNFAVISAGIYKMVERIARKSVQGSILVVVSSLFVFIVGVQPSIIRAYLCLLASIIVKFFLIRQYNGLFYLVFVLYLMLFLYPAWIFSISFQLSAAASLAILILQPRLHALLVPVLTGHGMTAQHPWVQQLLCDFTDAITVSVAAMIGTAPLLLLHFSELTLVGVFVTIIATYLLAHIVQYGFWTVIASIGPFYTPLSMLLYVWFMLLVYVPIELYLLLLTAAAQITIGQVSDVVFTNLHLVGAYCVIGISAWIYRPRTVQEERTPLFI